jgi:type IV pilus assembly protein PilA
MQSRKDTIRMLSSLRKRIEQDEEGFTLIELMVVVLIIAILLAIAIPTFLGARDRANNRAAQSSLRNALSSAKTLYSDAQDYTKSTDTALTTAEPSLAFVNGDLATKAPSDTFKTVSVYPVDANNWIGAALSKTNTCYYIRDSVTTGATGGTQYGETTGSSATTCIASTAPGVAFNADLSVGWK